MQQKCQMPEKVWYLEGRTAALLKSKKNLQPGVVALQKWRQKHQGFKTSLSYEVFEASLSFVKPYLKNTRRKTLSLAL